MFPYQITQVTSQVYGAKGYKLYLTQDLPLIKNHKNGANATKYGFYWITIIKTLYTDFFLLDLFPSLTMTTQLLFTGITVDNTITYVSFKES